MRKTEDTNNLKTAVVKCLLETAVIYSFLVAVMNLGVMISNGLEASSEAGYFSTLRTLLLIPASLAVSAATRIRLNKNIQGLIRWGLHSVLTVFGIYLFVVLPGTADATSGQKLVYLAVTAVIYVVVMLIISFVGIKLKQAVEDDRKYSRQY